MMMMDLHARVMINTHGFIPLFIIIQYRLILNQMGPLKSGYIRAMPLLMKTTLDLAME